jgi:predicted membrane channel-forming protein YqfA (hemolysin III family)
MLHYLKYFFKIAFGFMIIVALDTMLQKVDGGAEGWWFYITLVLYNSYCYLEYRLTNKDE